MYIYVCIYIYIYIIYIIYIYKYIYIYIYIYYLLFFLLLEVFTYSFGSFDNFIKLTAMSLSGSHPPHWNNADTLYLGDQHCQQTVLDISG